MLTIILLILAIILVYLGGGHLLPLWAPGIAPWKATLIITTIYFSGVAAGYALRKELKE